MGTERRRGFALVVVLWILAGLTVIAVAVASTVRSNAEGVRLLRDRVAAERAFLATGSRIKLLGLGAVSQGDRLFGLRGTVQVDGREIAVPEASDRVFLQDAHGLIALHRPRVLAKLLLHCGASSEAVPALIDALDDYMDADGLKRLNGAEAFEYSAAGKPPPRNAPLLSRDEVWRVLGWQAIRSSWEARACDELVTVRGDGARNRNTASVEVLRLDGMEAGGAQAVVDARQAGLLAGPGAQAETGSALAPMLQGGSAPVASVLRIRHQMPSVEWSLQYELEFTPSQPGGPWQVHELRIVSPRRLADSSATAILPPPDYLIPTQERARLNALSASPFDR